MHSLIKQAKRRNIFLCAEARLKFFLICEKHDKKSDVEIKHDGETLSQVDCQKKKRCERFNNFNK